MCYDVNISSMNMLYFVAFILASLISWTVYGIDISTTINCYTKGKVALQETCSATQYILIHSVESHEVSSCNDSSPGALWSRRGPEVHYVWVWCNLQKERCAVGSLDRTSFLKMSYTCVDELSSILRYNMCSYVSDVKSTPVYLHSPGYPKYHYNYTNGSNCTCNILSAFPTQGPDEIRLTVFDMFTQLPETLMLKWSNGTSKELATVAEPSSAYILNQETTYISSATVVSFVPRFPGQGDFWIGLESRVPLNISITCNGGLRTSPTLQATTATTTPTPATTLTTIRVTTPGTATTAAVMAVDDLKTIYIVVPAAVIVIVIVIVIEVIVKRRKHPGEDIYELPLPMSNTHATPSTDSSVYCELGITNPANESRDYNNVSPANGTATYENIVADSLRVVYYAGVRALAAHDKSCRHDEREADSVAADRVEYDEIPCRERSPTANTDGDDYEIPEEGVRL